MRQVIELRCSGSLSGWGLGSSECHGFGSLALSQGLRHVGLGCGWVGLFLDPVLVVVSVGVSRFLVDEAG